MTGLGERRMSEAKHHTMFASQAVGLAELFKWTVGKTKLDGPVVYTVELSAPDGPSTGGGKQALQHLSLVPEGGGPKLVIGSAHMVEKHAEMRVHAHVDEIHRQRFKGSSFQVEEGKYQALLDQIRSFFLERGFSVTLAEVPPATRSSTPATSSGAAPAAQASSLRTVMIVVVAVAVGALGMLLLGR